MAQDLDKDFVSATRLQAFSDAVYAIVATILVLPIRSIDLEENETLDEYFLKNTNLFVLYFIAFLIVCSIWRSHVTLFRVIAHVDDVLVFLNLLSLMFASFLPFTCRLEGIYGGYMLSIVLNCATLVIIEVLEITMVFYAFKNSHLLQEEYQQMSAERFNQRKELVLFTKVVNPVLLVLAAVVSSVNITASWILIGLVPVVPCIIRLLLIILQKCQRFCHGSEDYLVLTEKTVNKERKECFSDGVYSIVATLLVLDITNEHFPTKISHGTFDRTILAMWPLFLVYVAAFIVVALLWFVHHSLFHHLKKVNQGMSLCHNMSLAFTGAMPFVSSLLMKFGQTESNSDLKVAVQISSVIIFMASFMEFVVFVIALCQSTSLLEQDILPHNAPLSHNYFVTKALVIPLLSLVSYYSTFSTNSVAYIVHHICIFVAPLIFVMLKVVFDRCRRNAPMTTSILNPEREEVWGERLPLLYKRKTKKPVTLYDKAGIGSTI